MANQMLCQCFARTQDQGELQSEVAIIEERLHELTANSDLRGRGQHPLERQEALVRIGCLAEYVEDFGTVAKPVVCRAGQQLLSSLDIGETKARKLARQ